MALPFPKCILQVQDILAYCIYTLLAPCGWNGKKRPFKEKPGSSQPHWQHRSLFRKRAHAQYLG